eukprot:1158919-Pelagomonas_calceolata.AAC.4
MLLALFRGTCCTVYNRENRFKVAQDEAKAKEAEDAEEERHQQAEREYRHQTLMQRARKRTLGLEGEGGMEYMKLESVPGEGPRTEPARLEHAGSRGWDGMSTCMFMIPSLQHTSMHATFLA